ncbi:MAG TPA: hypothetical protein VLD19_15500, partial [Chitinophagaceae bacterium]|nr:hypothetical protein [Chitinophagaceae bacterium]
EKGLEKFPGAGELYLELGNMYVATKEYGKAIVYYENGIKADPAFPSNYYWAAKLYCSSKEEVWGMLYGEIFINLERNSKRTREISKLLFDTYKSQIKFSSKGDSSSVNFSQAVIDASEIKDPKNFKIPFSWGVYARILVMSIISEKQIDLSSLNRIRTRFIELYFQGDDSKKYPNVLFDYEQSMIKAGHFETYNHWLLSEGDRDAFKQWQAANMDKWTAFAKWFTDNKLQIDETHRFYRQQY